MARRSLDFGASAVDQSPIEPWAENGIDEPFLGRQSSDFAMGRPPLVSDHTYPIGQATRANDYYRSGEPYNGDLSRHKRHYGQFLETVEHSSYGPDDPHVRTSSTHSAAVLSIDLDR